MHHNSQIQLKTRETLISIAPMMERTDRHFRYFVRLLAPDIRLYTEMVTAEAVVRGDTDKLLRYRPEEHPVALQLGGNEPAVLAEAAAAGEARGFDEINLNIGCPSDRVRSGRFGACLMADPGRVAACVEAISSVVSVPVSVKTRTGIDDKDDFSFLEAFVKTVAKAGCDTFIVHARKAILGGMSPRDNLSIPPLRYPRVYRLKQQFPELRIILNGGVRSTAAVSSHLEKADGVMIGREAYRNPYWLSELQQKYLSPLFDRERSPPTRPEVLESMARYARDERRLGTPVQHVARHILGLYHDQPGARSWRRFVSEQARRPDAGAQTLTESLRFVESLTSGSNCVSLVNDGRS